MRAVLDIAKELWVAGASGKHIQLAQRGGHLCLPVRDVRGTSAPARHTPSPSVASGSSPRSRSSTLVLSADRVREGGDAPLESPPDVLTAVTLSTLREPRGPKLVELLRLLH